MVVVAGRSTDLGEQMDPKVAILSYGFASCSQRD